MRKKLLFVDDEKNILQGLKRMLRPYKDWQISIAESGGEALDMLAQSEYDCIISDMRMPGMDGAALLTEVHDKYPHVTRFVLSGHADAEPIMQAIPVTHQFLAKPCSAEQLVDTIKRACELHSLIKNDNLIAVIGKVDTLPSRPDVYAELMGALAKEDVSLNDVASIIEKDMAISAKILQVVNSAFFGLAQNISSVKNGVSYLGMSVIKTLVLSEEVFRTFENVGDIPGFSIDKEHRDSALSAHIAKKILKSGPEADNAFMAGMLQCIGRLIIAQYEPALLGEILKEQKDSDMPLYQIEQEKIGAPCSYIGAYLLGLWGLPYPVVEAVAHCHTPWAVPHKEFQALDALYLGNCLLAEFQADDSASVMPINTDYLEKLGAIEQLPAWRGIAAELLQPEVKH